MNSAGGIVVSSHAGVSKRLAARQGSVQSNSPAAEPPSESPRIGPWCLTQVIQRNQWLTTYRARPLLDRLGPGSYSLKTATPGQADDSLSRARLLRAIRVASEVSHCHLAAPLAVNCTATTPYLVLAYYDGVSLRQLLHRDGQQTRLLLPIAFALGIARQMASALAALHAARWLHGQIRPEHVTISPQGHATLIDLTLARRLETAECAVEGNTCDSPRYASPEHFTPRGRIAASADIYSLGIMLYETLTGEPPFTASEVTASAKCHRRHVAPDVRELRPLASRETSELVRRMLAKESLRRPTADQAVRWLAELEIEELSLL